MTEYKITIRNDYEDSAPRTYCIVSEAPLVNGGDIKPPELRTLVCHRTDQVAYEGQISFSFTNEFYGFIGEIKKNRRHKDEVSLHAKYLVHLGSDMDNGSKLNATVEGGCQIKPDTTNYATKGTFKILCVSKVVNPRRYVVGLAQMVENDRPVPVAAVPYRYGKEYTFRPGRHMCVRRGDEHVHEVVDLDRVAYTVPLGAGMSEVVISENYRGDFLDADGNVLRPNVRIFDRPQSPPPPYCEKKPQEKSQRDRPVRRNRPKYQRPVSEEAIKEGFTSDRQLFAYKFLRNFNETELARYHDDDSLRRIAHHAEEWGNLVGKMESLKSDMMDSLLVLALYDCVLLLDNSSSMESEEGRIDQLMDICEMIVEVESIFHNSSHVKVEFLNGKKEDTEMATPEHVWDVLSRTRYYGPTKLGGALREKILKDRVYKLSENERLRPLLISIITDGKPEWEPRGQLKHEMLECKRFLKEHLNLGDKHVIFQISQVGSDRHAAEYLHSLEHDKDLKRIVHCTSFLNLDIIDDAEHPIEQYSDAIQTLAGAALVDLADYREEHWGSVGI
ncbi:hypothetical protein VTO42DRAFT_2282 [Malbranchea cinnamomea]